jgi:5'-deoxynucleotidase YfbR-like HD superfamily hydrolase
MLSFVPRWSIAPKLTQQSVAEHCFYVALYASQLCDYLGIPDDATNLIVCWALRHDAPEVWTGDPPGPAKQHFIDPVLLSAYVDRFASTVDDFDEYRGTVTEQTARIIKIADLIDEVMYLRYELALGNTLVRDIYNLSLDRLRAKLGELGEQHSEYLMRCIQAQLSRIEAEGALIPALKQE